MKIKPKEGRGAQSRRELLEVAVPRRLSGKLTERTDLPALRSSKRIWRTRPRRTRLPELGTIALNRLGFGPGPGDVEHFRSLGSTDSSRLETYCEEQLHPESMNYAALQSQLDASGFTTLQKTKDQLWAEHVLSRPDYSVRMQSIRETERAAFIRAVHSPAQLLELLADFWHNHFSVYAWDYAIGPNFGAFDRDIIRANVFGNFREMLEGVATSSNMLFFLDNVVNSNAGPNENYARELFELHTLGSRNYLGVGRQRDVPLDGVGRPVGYVDDDIYEATRCFTGWTVNEDTGGLQYRSQWHDRFQKTVLGSWFPADQPEMQDGLEVLDLLVEHPGTADHIAWKLCRKLISDEPSPEIVAEASQTFQATRSAPDQLRQVVRTIILSNDFAASWGQKVKRPFELVCSFFRATGTQLAMPFDDSFSNSFLYLFQQTGHSPFAWQAPDGYPETRENWLGAQSFVANWRVLLWCAGRDIEDKGPAIPILAETPPGLETATELVDYWTDRMMARELDPNDRQELIRFMAQGRNPDFPVGLDTEDTQYRLRSLVPLIGMSPDFLQK